MVSRMNTSMAASISRGLFGLLLGAAAAGAAPDWRRAEDQVVLVMDGHTVWAFHHGAKVTKPYFHPLALPGGASLTEHRPADHPWHFGLWFSWKYINGINYWEEDRATGLPAGRTTWAPAEIETRPDGSARIALAMTYAPPDAEPVLTERRRLAISAPGENGAYWIDWTSAFTAGAAPVKLTVTPVNPARTSGGYAGLMFRAAHALKAWQVMDTEGRSGLAANGERAAGLDFSGELAGAPAGIAFLDHPSNPRHPTPWFLRLDEKAPYGLTGPAHLFYEPLTMAAGETLTFRYRIHIHPGRWAADALRAKAETFATE